MADDAKLASELAEFARHFILWLQENDIPDIPGLKGSSFDLFAFYAGTFQQYEGRAMGGMRYIPPTFLADADKAELDRLDRLSLGGRRLLIITNPNDVIENDRGEEITPNRIRRKKGQAITSPNALYVQTPRLASLRLDDATRDLYTTRDFASIRHRVDPVWDDKAAARRAMFHYLSIFDQQSTPRNGWKGNVADAPVPDEVVFQNGVDLRIRNTGEAQIAKRRRAYRSYLLNRGTYTKKGEHYDKWKKNPSRAPDDRVFKPTNLTDTYLRANFDTNEPKTGDTLLFIDLGVAFFVYRLFWEPEQGKPKAKFTVETQVRSISESVKTWPPRNPEALLENGVYACVFRALAGGTNRPNVRDIAPLARSKPDERFVVNYRAYVEWYYGDLVAPAMQLDEVFFDRFVRTLFPDQTYSLTLPAGHGIHRDDLFLNALRQQEMEAPEGPLREPLTRLRAWCEGDPNRFVFTQGARMGQGEAELLGVSSNEAEIYEWNPSTGLVTRTMLGAWLTQYKHGRVSKEVYANTKGVMPLVGVMFVAALTVPVTMVGMAVGGAVVGTTTLGNVARNAIFKLAKDQAEKLLSRVALRKISLQLKAMGLELVLRFFPDWQHPLYRFFRGIVAGFGGGALDHWLAEFDDRLAKQIPRIPHALAYAASPAAYRTYQVYVVADKLSAAAIRVSALHDSLKTVWTHDLPQQVAGQLRKFSKGLAIAFLILLVIALYFYEMSDSKAEAQRLKAKSWVKHQQETLQIVIKESSAELTLYANKLRALIAKVRAKGVDPADVSNHTELAEELKTADEELSEAIKGKLGSMAGKLSGAADFLALIFEHLGLESWQDLEKLGFMEVLAKGADALQDMPALSGEAVERLADGLGELISTIMMEKQLVPEKVKKTSGLLFGKPTSKVHKGVLAGGTPRAVLAFLTHPFEDLSKLPGVLRGAMEKSKPAAFTYKANGTRAQDLVSDLLNHDGSLSHRLMLLAEDKMLLAELKTLADSAASKPPPIFKDLTGGEDDWPVNAIAFVLFSWTRVAVREFGAMIDVLEDRTPFKGGKLNLATLMEVLGLDIPLDDPTVEALRARFTAAVKQP